MRNKNTYTVEMHALDHHGRDWGKQTITGTMKEICKEITGIYFLFPDRNTFTVRRNGRHKDTEKFTLTWWDFGPDGTEFYELEPEKDFSIYGMRGNWREALALELNRCFYRMADAEIYGHYF